MSHHGARSSIHRRPPWAAIVGDRSSSVPIGLSVLNGSVTFATAIDHHMERNINPDFDGGFSWTENHGEYSALTNRLGGSN